MNDPLTDLAPTLKSTDDSAEPFISSPHQQLISKLEHLSRYSSVIQIVTGPQGSGKSTFIQSLSSSFTNQEAITLKLSPNYETSAEELLREISASLDETFGDGDDGGGLNGLSLQQIEPKLERLKNSNRFLFLLIEHGEALNTGALKLFLDQLQGMNEAIRPHMIIFGQPVFAEKISQSPQFKSIPKSQCHFVEIPPFELLDTQAHLQHHYPEEAELLSQERITEIHTKAFGLPGLIEKALNKELLQPSNPKKSINIGKIAGTGLLLSVLIGIGAGASYVLWNLYTQPNDATEQVSINIPTPLETTKTTQPSTISQKPLAVVEEKTLPALPSVPAKTEASAVEPITQKASQPETPTVTSEANPDNLEIAATTSEADIQPTSDEDIAPVLTTPSQNKLVLQIKPAEPKAEKTAPATPAPAVSTTTKTAAETPATQIKPLLIKPSHPLLREDELLSWNANGYTLQMLGARKEPSVIDFIQSRSDKNKFYYFSTIYKEKPWYVVVYGQYQNRDEAVAAIRSLPSDLKQRKPWARSIKGVQDDIRRK